MKHVFLLLTICITFFQSYSQDSRGFSFQGIARDGSGNIYSNQSINLTIYLLKNTTLTSAIYKENQSVSTDAFGVFSTVIGKGIPQSGTGLLTNFSDIDFSQQLYVQVDAGIGLAAPTTLVQYELQSVPYAKYAYSSAKSNNAQKADTAVYVKKAENGVPPGTIMAFAGTVVPQGWLLCDGSSYDGNLDKYKELYNAIGRNWGYPTNPASIYIFNVPDMRGVFLRGVDGTRGLDPDKTTRIAFSNSNSGNKVGSYQNDNFASHNHDHIDAFWSEHRAGAPQQNQEGQANSTDNDNEDYAKWRVTSDKGGNETRPKNVYVYYIIKL